ncbi:hypothetical protein SBOR_6508 [Sclerotinia borealis F-4128]|uniref:Nineteen complex-related protein 2-domain-containing protein n=1 Tax=Sclerotinia borealis (strain F-4128) TaxID=1432307 RepID=W9C8M6_SCLBF|nr:hypothetical protein SBOR_6508 [Sclerotinia borealis F-4128]
MSAVRKPLKKSNLRRSIAFEDLTQDADDVPQSDTLGDDSPSNRPPIVKTTSFKKKKRPASSRLSFGVGDIISGSDAENLEDDESFIPVKKPLSRKVIEGNVKKTNARLPLPMRARDEDEDGDGDSGMGRPSYSKDYLKELKSSQASAMRDLVEVEIGGGEEPFLDASELEGAMVVDSEGNGDTIGSFGESAAIIPTEAEIREKKERRARMAREKDFISLNDDEPNGGRNMSLLPRQKKPESRLVLDDEEIMEGFEEFVDDGRISLGKKQEREERRRRKKQMADLIQQAEGSSDEESDDSEAERRAAYEVAQTRAGMDGLHKHDDAAAAAAREESQVPARITPIPVLSECLERLQNTLSTMELELSKRKRKMEEGEREKSDIGKREEEVQVLLTQAGMRYSVLKADAATRDVKELELEASDIKGLVNKSSEMGRERERFGDGDRGLESFGNTPVGRGEVVDGS